MAFTVGESIYPAGSLLIDTNQPGTTPHPRLERRDRVAFRLSAWQRAGRPAHTRRPPGYVQHLGQHAGGGLVAHAFDQFEVPYDLIYKERIRAAISAPPTTSSWSPARDDGEASGLRHRHARRGAAVPQECAFPSLGVYGESDTSAAHGLEGVLGAEVLRPAAPSSRWARQALFPADFGLSRSVTARGRRHVLRARRSRAGRDRQARPSDLLRLSGPADSGALRQRSAVAGAGARPRPAGVDALRRRRRGGPERVAARRRRAPQPAGRRGGASRTRPPRALCDQSLLPLAEPRRVRDAVQHRAPLERSASGTAAADCPRCDAGQGR